MKIYNTLTNKEEDFIPLKEGEVSMYVCGPTVYDFMHIGNARPMIIFDTLRRYFEYKGYKVKYVSNFTDVDDKIINRAKEEGLSALEVSEKYIKELEMLDSEYTDAVNSASVKTLLFADRFPFRYMTDDYGIEYYAAFDGCEADTEASFETIAFLSKKVDELSLKNIIKIDGSDGKIAETIKSNTQSKDQNIIELDSMQSVKDSDIEAGTSYISIMEKNLKVLKEALK